MPVSNAQLWKYKRYQASVYAGTSQFFGDVGDYSNGENVIGFKDLTLRQTRFSAVYKLRLIKPKPSSGVRR